MKSTQILAFVLLFLGVQTSWAQIPRDHTLRKVMGINVPCSNPTPSGYTFGKDMCTIFPYWTKIDERRTMFLQSSPTLVSADSNFVVICRAMRKYTIGDSISNTFHFDQDMKERSNYTVGYTPDYSHIREIEHALVANQGTPWFNRDSVYFYYTAKEARRMFNSDSVIRIPLDFDRLYGKHVLQTFPKENNDLYQSAFNKGPVAPAFKNMGFNHMEAYIITKKGRGFVAFYCFMNDEGRKEFPKHFKELQKMFRYKNIPPPNHGKIPRDSILRKAMKISVSRYKRYTFNKDWYTSPSPSRIMNNLSVTSTDSNFVAVCEALELFTRQDSIWTVELNKEVSKSSNKTLYVSPDYSHIQAIERCLEINQGTRRFTRDSAYFYHTHKEAREMFNADSVIRIPLDFNKTYRGYFTADPVHPSFRNRGFNHVEAYVITRKGRGYVIFYCLTTDKGQRDFKKHFRALQQIFRYEDD